MEESADADVPADGISPKAPSKWASGTGVKGELKVPKEPKDKAKKRSFPCGRCPVVSRSYANLKKHLMTHSGEKPFVCPSCRRPFRQRHHLADHLRTHTGEKPFVCELCHARFSQRSSLNLHRRRHSEGTCPGHMPLRCHALQPARGPFQCPECGQEFSRLAGLSLHRKVHRQEAEYLYVFDRAAHQGQGGELKDSASAPNGLASAPNGLPHTQNGLASAPNGLASAPNGLASAQGTSEQSPGPKGTSGTWQGDASQNRMKDALASSLKEGTCDPLVDPDQVRAALASGTVLETLDEEGKGFFIVLPPSLKDRDVALVSEAPEGGPKEPYETVGHEVDVRSDEGHYARVVRRELHPDGASLLLWNGGPERPAEVTYVLEEGKENDLVVRCPEDPGAEGRPRGKRRGRPVRRRKSYDCPQCGKSCRTSSNYASHLRTHSGERPYCCDFCGRGFKQVAHLRTHVRTHTGERPYTCGLCGASFTQSCRLNSHRRSRHAGGAPLRRPKPPVERKVRNFYCRKCDKTFIGECFKVDHMRSHLRASLKCDTCGVHCRSRGGLAKHLLSHSAAVRSPGACQGTSDLCISVKIGEEEDFVVVNRGVRDAEGDAEGDDCAFIDVTESLGARPEARRVPEGAFVKEETPEGAQEDPGPPGDSAQVKEEAGGEPKYSTHVDAFGRKVWACGVCDKTFLQSSNLHSHVRMHTGERPYRCNACPRAFRQITHLKDHMSRHTGTRPYRCGQCGSVFSQRSAVTRHIRTLHGVGRVLRNVQTASQQLLKEEPKERSRLDTPKDEIPKVEGDSKGRIQGLRDARRACRRKRPLEGAAGGTGEAPGLTGPCRDKPYTCNICNQALDDSALFEEHLERHGRTLQKVCQECGASFRRASTLRFHQSLKHDRVDDRYKDFSLLEQKDIKEEAEEEEEEDPPKGGSLEQAQDSGRGPRRTRNRRTKARNESTGGGGGRSQEELKEEPQEEPKEEPKEAYECQACGRAFSRSSKLKYHIAMWCKGLPPGPQGVKVEPKARRKEC